MQHPKLVIAAVMLATLQLGGCSATRLTYNNADWLLRREIIKFTCPSEAQEEWLVGQLARVHRWHRRQELPRYVKALGKLAGALDRPLKRTSVDTLYADLDGARERFSRRLSSASGVFLEGLAEPQIRCMIRKMDRWNRKAIKEVGRPDPRYVKDQREKLEDRLEDWLGDLSAAQRVAVGRLLGARKQTHRQMVTAWHNWGRRLVALLRTKGDRAARIKRLTAATRDRFALYTAAERKMVQRWEQQNRELTWAVARRMTASQRGQLKKRLLVLVKDFTALSGQ